MSLYVTDSSSIGSPTITLDTFIQAIRDGYVFSSADFFTIPDDSTRYMLFEASGVGVDGIISFRAPIFSSTGGPIKVNYYTDSDYTGGTALLSANRYIGEPDPLSVLTIDPTGTDVGTKVSGLLLPGGSTSQATSGTSASDPTPTLFPSNGDILIEVINEDNIDVDFGYDIVWLEYSVAP